MRKDLWFVLILLSPLFLSGCDSSPNEEEVPGPPSITATVREYSGTDTVAVGELEVELSSAFAIGSAPHRRLTIDSTLTTFLNLRPTSESGVQRGNIFYLLTTSLDDHAHLSFRTIRFDSPDVASSKIIETQSSSGAIDMWFLTLEDTSIQERDSLLIRYSTTIVSASDTVFVSDSLHYGVSAPSNYVRAEQIGRMTQDSHFHPAGSGLVVDFETENAAADIRPCFVQRYVAPAGSADEVEVLATCTLLNDANTGADAQIDMPMINTGPVELMLLLLEF